MTYWYLFVGLWFCFGVVYFLRLGSKMKRQAAQDIRDFVKAFPGRCPICADHRSIWARKS